MWAIVDEGRLFFRRNPVASVFAPGTMFTFSTCLLEGITDSVRNAIPIQRAMFPREWMARLKSPDALYGGPKYGGPPPGPPPTWEPAPALPPTPPGGPTPTRPGGYEDTCHPKIKRRTSPLFQNTATQRANLSCVGIAFWGDASADLGAGLPGAI
jgi:hypothetical protein